MKKLIAALLLLTLVLGLCACTENEPDNTTAGPTQGSTPPTASTPAPTEPSEPAADGYVVTVTDTEGNPIANAVVQLCKLGDDGSCTPGMTDEDGKAVFVLEENSYKVSFVVVPAGYTYVDENQEFYFEEGAKEITVTLKKA